MCQTPGRCRPLVPGRFVNSAIRGPALDAISIRAAVVCVSCCAFVAVETGQHPLPLPGLGSKCASLPYMANEIVVATPFVVPHWRICQYFHLLLFAGCRWIPIVFAINIPFRLFQHKQEIQNIDLGGILPHKSISHGVRITYGEYIAISDTGVNRPLCMRFFRCKMTILRGYIVIRT